MFYYSVVLFYFIIAQLDGANLLFPTVISGRNLIATIAYFFEKFVIQISKLLEMFFFIGERFNFFIIYQPPYTFGYPDWYMIDRLEYISSLKGKMNFLAVSDFQVIR